MVKTIQLRYYRLPRAGIEPAPRDRGRILSPLRLPIPPSRRQKPQNNYAAFFAFSQILVNTSGYKTAMFERIFLSI